ncbi:MAG: 30S ribosomal protein S12 methylthiotransferase RimO [Deltaproteobacteria bacterium]|nr:30S ribosomal protein S12 methylthiotransferase RimO [Deltaproteobacteria bacterium]
MSSLRLPVLSDAPTARPAAGKGPGRRGRRPRVHFVSLGCARNRVDAEHMLGLAQEAGFDLTERAEGADAVVVNTCSFIGEAKQESVDAILQFCDLRQKGALRSLVVTGCLAQRYSTDLGTEIPEVDHFLGTGDYTRIAEVLQDDLGRGEHHEAKDLVTHELEFLARYDLPRVNTLHQAAAYLKISEGCDNDCAFCIIPKLRGTQRSRTAEDLVREAEQLAASGVKELTLIAEDLTAWGHDLPGRPNLGHLLRALGGVKGIRWIRCMYAYPRTFNEHVITAFTDVPAVLPYLDIPVQHGSDRVLKLMRRGRDTGKLRKILLGLRDRIPRLVLRSTVIVGFPGETERDFEELLDFVEEIRFERLGAFRYSDEENTPAYDFPDRVPAKVKRARWEKLMRRQRRISRAQQEALLGTEHECLVEGPSPEHPLLLQGRLWSQAPEVDGVCYISSDQPLTPGDLIRVRVTQAHDYDVTGELVEEN